MDFLFKSHALANSSLTCGVGAGWERVGVPFHYKFSDLLLQQHLLLLSGCFHWSVTRLPLGHGVSYNKVAVWFFGTPFDPCVLAPLFL